jgi:uncharacterized protein (DUF58 family)
MPINRNEFQNLSQLEFMAKQVVEGFLTGLHKSPFHGFSVEFAEHRLYNTGESTRHIDWKLFARTDKLFIKKYEEETNLRCHILIDTSSSMNFPHDLDDKSETFNKLKFSVYAAAALIELLRRQRDAVGITFFDESTTLHTQAKSSLAHHKFLYYNLENLLANFGQIGTKTSAAKAIDDIAEQIHKRSLVIIFSDMMDSSSENEQLFAALQHLKYNKHEVILFHVIDKSKELDFDFENRPYTFVDAETGEEVKAHPARIKETYLKAITEHTNQLKLKCAQYKIDFVEADIKSGFNTVLMEYLIKRNKLN